MKRRSFLAAPGALALAPHAAAETIQTKVVRLKLRHTWTTVMSSSDYRDNLYLQFQAQGVTGHGEGAPIVRYHEDAESARHAVESVRDLLTSADPWQFSKLMTAVFRRTEGQNAARAAIDIALMDWVGQKLRVPLYRYFGLDPKDAPVTTFSIGIDTPEITRQKTRERGPLPGAQNQGRPFHRRGDYRSRPQRHQKASPRGRQRRLEG